MKLQVTEIIRKKRQGESLNEAELGFLLRGYLDGTHKDYHLAAFLMAVFFRGMSSHEMRAWTRLMWHSGITFPRPSKRSDSFWPKEFWPKEFWIDKHSTGGVGDKTSLLLVPLVHCVCERVLGAGKTRIPMISGRGLDFTGGTLDKLDSVPGFSSDIALEKAVNLLQENGFFLLGQTSDLAPADRLLYALRDVTATVDCLPLVVSSILSKKLAENLDGLVLDVKVGCGALMKDLAAARELARALKEVAEAEGVRTSAVLTAMDEPLGWKVGHQLEIEECMDYLVGRSREPGLHEVTLTLASEMIHLVSRGSLCVEMAKEECERELAGPGPQTVFRKMFHAQGGDVEAFERRRSRLDSERARYCFKAKERGYVSRLDAGEIGKLVRSLGGGRLAKDSKIDLDVGVVLHKKVGSPLEQGDTVFEVCYSDPRKGEEISEAANPFFQITTNPVSPSPWILEVMRA